MPCPDYPTFRDTDSFWAVRCGVCSALEALTNFQRRHQEHTNWLSHRLLQVVAEAQEQPGVDLSELPWPFQGPGVVEPRTQQGLVWTLPSRGVWPTDAS